MKNIKVIGFDADDTLWVNEPYFQETERQFCQLLKDFLPEQQTSSELFKTEMQNLELYGYGAKSFILSLIETALRISNGNVPQPVIGQILNLGKELLEKPVVLLNHVDTVLPELCKNYRLVVATKGDLLDQERKLEKSGLVHLFHHIEIMSDKREKDYRELIDHLDIVPGEFLMVGNSLKSDILPVINLGAKAIYVPYHTTWQHEMVEEPANGKDGYHTISDLREIYTLLKRER